MGDHVVVINTKNVVLTGKKWDDKLYRHHTGWGVHSSDYNAYNNYGLQMLTVQLPRRSEGESSMEGTWERLNKGIPLRAHSCLRVSVCYGFQLTLVALLTSHAFFYFGPTWWAQNFLHVQILWKAVNGMLPKNLLRKKRMKRLHLFPNEVNFRVHRLPNSAYSYLFYRNILMVQTSTRFWMDQLWYTRDCRTIHQRK